MGLEVGDLITNLNVTYPLDIDDGHEGNNHFWLVKTVLKNTFAGRDENGDPEDGWDSVLTVNPEEINFLEGLDQNLDNKLADLDTLIYEEASPNVVVVGKADNTHAIRLETTGNNGVVHQWGDGNDDSATSLNTANMYDYIGNVIYPVGSVIYSADNTNPKDRFPGDWVRIAEGRFVIGVSNSGDYTDPNGVTHAVPYGDISIGEYEHTLTEPEIPAHVHEYGTGLQGAGHYDHRFSGTHGRLDTEASARPTYTELHNVGTRGDPQPNERDQPHNNIPPGFGLYIWRRVS